MNTTRGIVGALLTIVLAAGCAAEPAEPKPAPTPSKAGVWEKTISRLGPDGRLPKDAALDAFTLAVGPLPGVTRPTGEIGGLSTGTIAVSSVLARWQELTEPQRQAVLNALDTKLVAGPPSGGGAIGQRRPGRDPNLACHTKDSPGAEPHRAMLDDAIAKISAKLGRSLTIQPVVTVDTREDPKERSWMYTWPCAGVAQSDKTPDGRVTGCTVHIRPRSTLARNVEEDVRGPLIHEAMHCFQLQKYGLGTLLQPDWYREGVASWVMSVLGPPNNLLTDHWFAYLDHPNLPLNDRTYDGIGFFAHLAETGTDPWNVIDRMGTRLLAGGTPAGWHASGMSGAFESDWGSGFAQDRSLGAAWMSTGPNLPEYLPGFRPSFEQETLSDGGSVSAVSNPTAARVKQLQVEAEVVQVYPDAAASGRLSLGGGADATLDAAQSATYCTLDASTCKCPPDSGRAGTKFTHLERGVQYLGMTGGLKGAKVTVTGQSLKDFCAAAKPARWRAVSVHSRSSLDLEHDIWRWNVDGGAGIVLEISKQGGIAVNYSGMQRLTYSISSDMGLRQNGTIVCSGIDRGSLAARPAAGKAGPWSPSITAIGSTGTIDVVAPSRMRESAPPGKGGCGAIFRADLSHPGTWKQTAKSLTITTALDQPGGQLINTWTFAPA